MCCISQHPGAGTHPWLSEPSSPLLEHEWVESMIKRGQKPGEMGPKLEAKLSSAASEGQQPSDSLPSFSLDTFMDKESTCHVGVQQRR